MKCNCQAASLNDVLIGTGQIERESNSSVARLSIDQDGDVAENLEEQQICTSTKVVTVVEQRERCCKCRSCGCDRRSSGHSELTNSSS
jgi:hypothetical protein